MKGAGGGRLKVGLWGEMRKCNVNEEKGKTKRVEGGSMFYKELPRRQEKENVELEVKEVKMNEEQKRK